MSFYALPSFINLVIKAWLFWHGRQSLLQKNRCLGALLLSFFFLNLAELISFYLLDYVEYREIIGRAYYVTVVSAATMMLVYADHISYRKIPWTIPLIAASNVCLLIIFTNEIIAGVDSLGYIITRVAGAYYWIIQLYLLSCVLGAPVLLFMGYRNLPDLRQKKVCKLMLISFLPIVITSAIIIIMMAFGARINAAIYVTSSITIFLLVVIHAESNYHFMNIITMAPAFGTRISSSFYRTVKNIFIGQSIDLKSLIRELEDILIVSALELSDGRRQDAAYLLGIPQSTFNEKLRKIKNLNLT